VKITRSSSTSPVMYKRSRTMIGDDQPRPRWSIFQRSFGPPSGHEGKRFFSPEISSRRGPRHCGQSGSGEAIGPSSAAGTACADGTLVGPAGGCSPPQPAAARKIAVAQTITLRVFIKIQKHGDYVESG
jgi:hypothetical protein